MPLKTLPALRQLNHLAPNDIGRLIFAQHGFGDVVDQVRDGLLSRPAQTPPGRWSSTGGPGGDAGHAGWSRGGEQQQLDHRIQSSSKALVTK